MKNTKLNGYELFIISHEHQVFAFDYSGNKHQLSEPDFALDISISDYGILWAITLAPDQEADGGGTLFWSLGDGTWNEVTTPHHGGKHIAGGPKNSCFYITGKGKVRTLDIEGESEIYDDTHNFLDFDYGGGCVWAVFPETQGAIPRLFYCEDASNLEWKPFTGTEWKGWSPESKPRPRHIAVGCYGECFGIGYNNWVFEYRAKDQNCYVTYGLDESALDLSVNNSDYAVASDTEDTTGKNFVYKRSQLGDRKYEKTSIRAMKVLSNYPIAYPDNMNN